MQNKDSNLGNRDIGNRSPGVTGGNVGGRAGEQNVGDKMRQGWDQFRTRVRGKYTDLTDRDLDQYQGRRRDDLVGFIGQRTGGRREEIDRDLDTIARDTGYRFE